MTRPGGTAGRVGCGTGVDEAPVPDAGSTIRAFSSESLPRTRSGVDAGSREENASNENPSRRSSVIAGANAAHVVAIGIELTNPAAAAIAVIVVAVVAGGDRAADHGGADETGSNTWLLPGWCWRCCR